jgi:hypothetical protein
MPWTPAKKLDWTWYEDYATVTADGDVAKLCARLASERKIVKHIFPVGERTVCVLSCRGVAQKSKAKKNVAEEEATE